MRGQLESDPACQMKLCPIVQAIGAEWMRDAPGFIWPINSILPQPRTLPVEKQGRHYGLRAHSSQMNGYSQTQACVLDNPSRIASRASIWPAP